MSTTNSDRAISPQAHAILVVLAWERDRPEAVTIDEIVRRLPFTRDAAKRAVGELLEAGLITWEVAAAYQRPDGAAPTGGANVSE